MLYCIAILIGLLMAVFGAKKGFYTMWATVFNILVSIYLGVMLTPFVIGLITKKEVSTYYCAASIAGLALIVFVILQCVLIFIFLQKYKILFPNIMDTYGAGILGFISGYLICAFVIFVISLMPLNRNTFEARFLNSDALLKVGGPPVIKVCDFIGEVSLQCSEGVAGEVVDNYAVSAKLEKYSPYKKYRDYGDPNMPNEFDLEDIENLQDNNEEQLSEL